MRIYDVLPPEKIKRITKEILGLKEYKTKKEKILNIGTRITIFLFLISVLVFEFTPLKFSLSFLFPEETKEEKERFYPVSAMVAQQGVSFEEKNFSQEGFQGIFSKYRFSFFGNGFSIIFANFQKEGFEGEIQLQPLEGEKIEENQPEDFSSPEENDDPSFPPDEKKSESDIFLPPFLEEGKEKQEEPLKETIKEEENREENFSQSFLKKLKGFFENRVFASTKSDFFAKLVIFVLRDSPEKEKSQFSLSYSFDGENWITFAENLILKERQIGFFEFELPINNLEEIEKLQIKIESQDSFSSPFYLDVLFVEIAKSGDKPKEKFLFFDFQKEKIEKVIGIEENLILLQMEDEEGKGIWLVNLKERKKEKISNEKGFNFEFPVGIKENLIFWLSADRNEIVVFNLKNQEIFSKKLPVFDCTKGERGKIEFFGFSWKVLVGCENFSFFREDRGEIFSDGNSLGLEKFKKIFELEKFFSPEQLREIGFSLELKETNIEIEIPEINNQNEEISTLF